MTLFAKRWMIYRSYTIQCNEEIKMQVVHVKIQSDSVKPTILKIITESAPKAIDTARELYYPFPKSRDNVILQIIKTEKIGE